MIKHMGKTTVFFLVAAFVFASLSYAQGQPDPQQNPQKGARMGIAENFKKQLNITPEQEAKLKALREARQKDAQAFNEKMNKLQTELRDLRKDPKADQKKAEGLIDDVYKLRAAREKDMFRNRNEVNKIFTPEQLEKMKQARGRLQGMGARLGQMRGRMLNAPGGLMGRGMMGRGGFGLGFGRQGFFGGRLRPNRLGMMLRFRLGQRSRWRW